MGKSDLAKRVKQLESAIQRERRDKRGSSIRGLPHDPPSYNTVRWNKQLVRFVSSGATGTLKVSDLEFNITNELGLFGTTSGTPWRVPLELLLKDIRMYSTISGSTLDASFFDFTGPDNGSLITLSDTGTAARPAKIGYHFPSYVSENPQRGPTEAGRIISNYAVSNGFVAIYATVLWRAYATS